jgi:hypothetical protein
MMRRGAIASRIPPPWRCRREALISSRRKSGNEGIGNRGDGLAIEIGVENRKVEVGVSATGYGEMPEPYRDRPTLMKPFQLDGLKQMLQSAFERR